MRLVKLASIALLFAFTTTAFAASTPEYKLVIEGQTFHPATLTIPAGQAVDIIVKNADAIPAEFESYDLNRERVIPGNTQVTVHLAPMEPGSYGFFNEFHPSSKGKVIVE